MEANQSQNRCFCDFYYVIGTFFVRKCETISDLLLCKLGVTALAVVANRVLTSSAVEYANPSSEDFVVKNFEFGTVEGLHIDGDTD